MADLSHAKVETKKKFLNKKLKYIFSGVNDKHGEYNKSANEELIQALIIKKDFKKDSEYNFKEFFELSFLDCLNHLNMKKISNILIGLEKSEEEILKDNEQFEEDEINNYKEFVLNYEEDINNRKSRNPKKTKIND